MFFLAFAKVHSRESLSRRNFVPTKVYTIKVLKRSPSIKEELVYQGGARLLKRSPSIKEEPVY